MSIFKGILDGIKTIKTAVVGNDWSDQQYSEFSNGKVVYDRDVADYTAKHLTLVDRLSMRKTASAVMASFDILSGSCEEPDVARTKPDWKYFRDC